ncbi:dihydroxyacetone kinase Dak1 [Dactylonectria macrodidyma]|uniref:Dihydroxyacetone kinase Dak1 n=1 Tax=Dactylonectria macrodidyma TaxID=307937 RepID=A0A9P9IP36_9HYPO|nr:dihydroxyacetone kinase Dak1 [Dactylonectria macrodidyma]
MSERNLSIVLDSETALWSALDGFVALHPSLQHNEEHRVIYRNSSDKKSRVTLISGGGSGHEPAHVGYVGHGMLDAAVCGAVFASPNALQIEGGLKLIESPRGILVIVKNYTGDKLNFSLAADRFRFTSRTPIRLVIVSDDVSIGRTRSGLVGRRGLAGTVLVHKVAGAASVAGLSLDEVADVAEFATKNMGTIGVGLDSCSMPGQAPKSRLQPDELEIGIGIHNEPGSKRVQPRPSLSVLVKEMMLALLDTTDAERNYIENSPRPDEHDVVLLVNNLGSLSQLEMAAATGEVVSQLKSDYAIKPSRMYCGTFLSALNGPGFSITLLSLPKNQPLSGQVLQWLDAPTDALGWTSSISTAAWNDSSAKAGTSEPVHETTQEKKPLDGPSVPCNAETFTHIVKSVHASLVAAEPEITRMDTILGDGDCGTTLLSGSASVVAAIEDGTFNSGSLSQGIMDLANVLCRSMGGTSGALYSVFFTGLASAISSSCELRGAFEFRDLADAAKAALNSLQSVTAAREGDRTMMDALIPFVNTLSSANGTTLERLDQAVAAADAGCQLTRDIQGKFGRSTYVGAEEGGSVGRGIPDPGACGVFSIVTGIRDALKGPSN